MVTHGRVSTKELVGPVPSDLDLIALMEATNGGITMDWIDSAPIDRLHEIITALKAYIKAQKAHQKK